MSEPIDLTDNFQHSVHGPRGVNGKYFVDMEPYLQTEKFAELHKIGRAHV